MAKKVKLETAFYWVCPACNTGQFELPIEWDGNEEDKEDIIRKIYNLEEWQEMPNLEDGKHLIAAPDSVKCRSCKKTFEVASSDFERDLDEDEDDEELY